MKDTVRTLLICNSLIFFGWVVQASEIEGRWAGSGQMTQKSNFAPINKTEPCPSIDISFSQGQDSIVVEKYHGKCGLLDSEWGPLKFELKGQIVYNDGDAVGTFDGDLFKATMPSSGATYAFNFQFVKENEKVIGIRSYYGVQNMVGTIVIEGSLAKK